MSIEALMKEFAPRMQEVWSDVDGVMTPQASLQIFDVTSGTEPATFERVDGDVVTYLLPCDENGVAEPNTVEYLAGVEGELMFEGYRFDTRDGKVTEYLTHDYGMLVYFISGRNSACVRVRAKKLGAIPLLGEKDKLPVIQSRAAVPLSDILFFADGIQDVEAMRAIKAAGGLTVAPADACAEAKAAAVYVSPLKGGEGVLNEVISVYLNTVSGK
jgi:3-deoxy-D-manno-octulosonate 8-phosphate phosphatase (KDO 8-P phosphatase)